MYEEAIDAKPFPRGMLIAVAAMVGLSILFAASASLWDFGATRIEYAPVTDSRDLVFKDLKNGSVGVVDAAGQQQIAEVKPGQDGFVRVVMRSMARDRAVRGVGSDVAFRLARLDGLPRPPAGGRQPILGKEDHGPEHQHKAGTPTMGGIAIVGAAFIGWVAAHVRRATTWPSMKCASSAVNSGAMLIVISTLATVVRVSANMKQVNITAHSTPPTSHLNDPQVFVRFFQKPC